MNEPNIHHSSVQGHEPSVQGHEPSVQGHEPSVQASEALRKAVQEMIAEAEGVYLTPRKLKKHFIRCTSFQRAVPGTDQPDPGFGRMHFHFRIWRRSGKPCQVLYITRRGDMWEIPQETLTVMLLARSESELVSWLSRISRKDFLDEPSLLVGKVDA